MIFLHYSGPLGPGPELEKIRQLDAADFPQPWKSDDWRTLQWENFGLYVLMKGEALLGFCLFQELEGDDCAHLLKIVIAKRFRGQGLARRLLSYALKHLKEKSFQSIYLEVEADNLAAVRLYENFGWHSYRRLAHFYGPKRDAFSMGGAIA